MVLLAGLHYMFSLFQQQHLEIQTSFIKERSCWLKYIISRAPVPLHYRANVTLFLHQLLYKQNPEKFHRFLSAKVFTVSFLFLPCRLALAPLLPALPSLPEILLSLEIENLRKLEKVQSGRIELCWHLFSLWPGRHRPYPGSSTVCRNQSEAGHWRYYGNESWMNCLACRKISNRWTLWQQLSSSGSESPSESSASASPSTSSSPAAPSFSPSPSGSASVLACGCSVTGSLSRAISGWLGI